MNLTKCFVVLVLVFSNSLIHATEPELHLVIRDGDEEKVQELLAAGVDANVRSVTGRTPLHVAASDGSVAIMNMLLKSKADPNVQALNKNSPLHLAVERRADELVALLLDNKANPNVVGRLNITPLQQAMRFGLWDIAQLLLQYGADPNVQDQEQKSRTPLHGAVLALKKELIDLLLEKGAHPNAQSTDGEVPLNYVMDDLVAQQVSKDDAFAIIQSLLKKGANPNIMDSSGNLPLALALRAGNYNVARLLLEHEADPSIVLNKENWTPLHYAVRRQKKLVPLLIEKGADPTKKDLTGFTPLAAAERKYKETGSEEDAQVVQLLKEYTNRFSRGTVVQPTKQAVPKKPVSPVKSPARVQTAKGGGELVVVLDELTRALVNLGRQLVE